MRLSMLVGKKIRFAYLSDGQIVLGLEHGPTLKVGGTLTDLHGEELVRDVLGFVSSPLLGDARPAQSGPQDDAER